MTLNSSQVTRIITMTRTTTRMFVVVSAMGYPASRATP
jgi:hypothetical protein